MTRQLEGKGDEPWHGTIGGYTNHACGCGPCTEANAENHRNFKKIRRRLGVPKGVDPDTYHAYDYYGSRTPGALAANSERRRQQVARQREAS